MAKFNELDSFAEEYHIGDSSRSGFLKLEVGDNVVRIVSEYEVIGKHFSGRGTRPMTCVGLEDGCPRCKMAADWDVEQAKQPVAIGPDGKPVKKAKNPYKLTPKFLLYVIDRKDGQIKLAEFGWSIMSSVKELNETKDYEFSTQTGLPDYDMTVRKVVKGTGANPSDTGYAVFAARSNTPLTDDEKARIAKLTPIKDLAEAIKNKAKHQEGKSTDESEGMTQREKLGEILDDNGQPIF